MTCAPRCSATCSSSRSRSLPGRRPGRLVSRLNSDVIGAQQAITSTMSSVVSNILTVSAILVTMFLLSWQISLIALVLIPLFLLPARRVGRRLQRLTRESMQLDAAMGSTMTERFNVAGAMLVKLFGRPREESEVFAERAGRVRDIGVIQSMYGSGVLHLADPARRAGDRGGLRARRHPGHPRRAPGRHPGRAVPAAGQGLRPDRVAVQRPDQRDDRAGQLRPGVRDPRPQAADRRTARRGGPARQVPGPQTALRRAGDRVRRRVVPVSVGERGVAGLAGVDRAARARAPGLRGRGPARRELPRAVRAADRPGRPVGRRQDHDHRPGGEAVRPERGRGANRRPRHQGRHAGVAARRGGSGHPGRAPVPRHDPGQLDLRAGPRPPNSSSSRRARRPRSGT